MEKTLRSVSQISFFFFLVFGALHIGASMLMVQGLAGEGLNLVFRTLDLPFIFAALVYGSTRVSLHVGEITGSPKIPAMVCSALAAVIFVMALYFNFMLPDVQL